MFKKLNTRTLVVVLLILAGLAALNKFYFQKKGESTFQTEFVKIDTGAVTQVLIYPKAENGKEIKMTRTAKGWDLQFDKIKTVADTAAVHGLLANFVDLKALSLAAEDKSGWTDLQVGDTTGSRIKIITGDNHTYDMMVGKFGYNNIGRNGVTYIRHYDETAVYTIDGFLSFNVNRDFMAWRNKTFISGNKENWTSLTFNYPGDSSFTLAKQNNQWMINGIPADSAKTFQYLSEISNKQSTGFVDQTVGNNSAAYSLAITGNNQAGTITVQAFPSDSTQKFILHSSLNPDAWFSEVKSPLVQSVFVSKEHFLKQE